MAIMTEEGFNTTRSGADLNLRSQKWVMAIMTEEGFN